MISKYDILIIGGGAAGFFTAINIVEKKSAAKGRYPRAWQNGIRKGTYIGWWSL